MQTLKDRISSHIKTSGPMNIASYMGWCLLDPKQGYYPTRDPLGIDGDFITAPEISQMFGEVLGLWLLQSWKNMGAPETVQLVEYGPGRGLMMADILRTARLDPGFFRALRVTLIETSAALEAKQAQTLANCAVPVTWASKLSDVTPGPTLVIGNEYLDCLPIRQFVMKDRFAGRAGWHERLIDIHPDNPNKLVYTLAAAPISKADQSLLPAVLPEAKDGDLLEISTGLSQVADALKARFAAQDGAALFIDYGPEETEFGDTFQAIVRHEKSFPLAAPGEADLTARVDFAALKQAGEAAGFSAFGPVPQGRFLSKLGVEMRAVALSKASPDDKPKIARQLHRLTHADEMGTLFKAMALQSEGLPTPLGFTP